MLTWTEDQTGYPMIYIPSLRLWIHALPITKIQFEVYLSNANDFGNSGYREILVQNPRVSFRHFDDNDYEGLFLTGVSVRAVQKYLSWCGINYQLPDNRQWKQAYSWLLSQPVHEHPTNWNAFSQSAQAIWEGLGRIHRPQNLAEQMLMQGGILEWVIDRDKLPAGYGGMGRPHSSFWNVLRHPADAPVHPIEDIRPFGFRLIRSDK